MKEMWLFFLAIFMMVVFSVGTVALAFIIHSNATSTKAVSTPYTYKPTRSPDTYKPTSSPVAQTVPKTSSSLSKSSLSHNFKNKKEDVINTSYNFIQRICDKDKWLASLPKSAYKAEEKHKLWFVRIVGYEDSTYYDSGTFWGSPIKETSMTVLTIDGSEKKDGKPNPNFGVPKFNLSLGVAARDYDCGTGWRKLPYY
tara:strand:+ start:142 stop:735 length:594 start_codon:yes stop_codon:yes gene_type:complete